MVQLSTPYTYMSATIHSFTYRQVNDIMAGADHTV